MFNRGRQGVLWHSPSFKAGGKSLVFVKILECAEIEPKTLLLLGSYPSFLRTPRVLANNIASRPILSDPLLDNNFWSLDPKTDLNTWKVPYTLKFKTY